MTAYIRAKRNRVAAGSSQPCEVELQILRWARADYEYNDPHYLTKKLSRRPLKTSLTKDLEEFLF